jgi:hypothetical protein
MEEVRRHSMEEDEPSSPSGTQDGEGFGDADGLMSPGAAKGMNTAQKMSLAALAHTNVNENFRVRIHAPSPEPRAGSRAYVWRTTARIIVAHPRGLRCRAWGVRCDGAVAAEPKGYWL